MRNTEHVAYRAKNLPSKSKRHRLQMAMRAFEKAYLEWLRSTAFYENGAENAPNPEHFGLAKSHVATLIQHCKSVVAKEQDRRIPRHD